jgi:hypothetical protein
MNGMREDLPSPLPSLHHYTTREFATIVIKPRADIDLVKILGDWSKAGQPVGPLINIAHLSTPPKLQEVNFISIQF